MPRRGIVRAGQARAEFVALVPLVADELPDYPVTLLAEAVAAQCGLRTQRSGRGSVDVYFTDKEFYRVDDGALDGLTSWPPWALERVWR